MFEIVELGHYALNLALGLSLAQVVVGAWGVIHKDMRSIALSVRATKISFYLVSIAFLALIISFLQNDFTVKYVALNSNVNLAWYYKISAVWAGHEGSLLLWVWILTLWSYLIAIKTTTLPPQFRGKVVAVLGVIATGFLSFVIVTSNPFTRLLPTNALFAPVEGKDLNPMLQDVGLILHPPLLYMGYVGFAVSFAFIVVALLEGRLDTRWARWCRPWTIAAWSFLTVGIAVGSWWAYYELGWGGWWFWDPVENASFMPWLAGTALIHSLSATEKRDVFKVWTAFLAITTFSLSLIGTFLVRSGVLTSVHAFASDPTRGVYILLLLAFISGSAFFLLVVRGYKLHSTGQYEWLSRELMLLINNIILTTGCLIVFIGTLTPLLYDVLGWERISVGAPYFNAKMLWVLVFALVFLTFAPYVRWKRDRVGRIAPLLILAVVLGVLTSYWLIKQFSYFDWQAFILVSLTISAILTTFFDVLLVSKRQRRLPSFAYVAMFVGHLGFLVCSVGIIISGTYSVEKDVYVKIGDTVTVDDLSFEAKYITYSEGNQYDGATIAFAVRSNDKVIAMLRPEKRIYHSTRMPISETAIAPSLQRDVYMALGGKLGGELGEKLLDEHSTEAWSVRIQIKPYIRWIWLGALIMASSCFFVVFGRRFSGRSRKLLKKAGRL